MTEENIEKKRGRPKKLKSTLEIEQEKQKKKELQKKWYQENKNDIREKHKNYYKEYKEYKQEELKVKSKKLQSRYREGYRLLCKLVNDKAIIPSYTNLEEIEKFTSQ